MIVTYAHRSIFYRNSKILDFHAIWHDFFFSPLVSINSAYAGVCSPTMSVRPSRVRLQPASYNEVVAETAGGMDVLRWQYLLSGLSFPSALYPPPMP